MITTPFTKILHRLLLSLLLGFLPDVTAEETGSSGGTDRVAAKSAVEISVSLDRDGWIYATGEKAYFTAKVTRDGQPLAGVELSYQVGPEMMQTGDRKAVTDASGRFAFEGVTLAEPGFIRCIVGLADQKVNRGGSKGRATAGFSPEKIQPTQVMPADFAAFWEEGKAALAKVPMDAVKTRIPELCTPTVEVYHVSVRNVGRAASTTMTARVYGMLAEPKAPGKYPAILRVPGAGVRGYAGGGTCRKRSDRAHDRDSRHPGESSGRSLSRPRRRGLGELSGIRSR